MKDIGKRLQVISILMVFAIFTAVSVTYAKNGTIDRKKLIKAHSQSPKESHRNIEDVASTMGLIVLGLAPQPDGNSISASALKIAGPVSGSASLQIPNNQSETTIAVHGNNVVVGYNDFRGFAVSSVSGYSYSTNGGASFTDGGQLPTGGGGNFIAGDPDIKVWDSGGTVYFLYSSIFLPGSGASSLSVHKSTDGGMTWSSPQEVTAATSFSDFADKEYISVDEETGRLFISWSNFKANGSIEMAVAYSDDQGATWSSKIGVANRVGRIFDGQGTITRADPNSDNVYMAWRTFRAPFFDAVGVSFAYSTDNGATWSDPIDVETDVLAPEAPYGFDRVNSNPALEVDPFTGEVYLAFVHQGVVGRNRNRDDFGDLYFYRSKNGGKTWSTRRVVSGQAPGRDRTQMFPWISVDKNSGSLDIVWYDQRRGTGVSDLTEVYSVHSDDGGISFSCPHVITPRPFHSDYGNDFSAPHQGDYIQSASLGGTLYACSAVTPNDPFPFDSQIDFEVDQADQVYSLGANVGPVLVNGVEGGIVAPGAQIALKVLLASNCQYALGGVEGHLTSLSGDASVSSAWSHYPKIQPQGFTANNKDFVVNVDGGATPGEFLDFELELSSRVGEDVVQFRLQVGTASVGASFFSEDFEGVTPPALPAGWTNQVSGGWTTLASLGNPGNAAFIPDPPFTALSRLFSPTINLPGGVEFYDIEFDEFHHMEPETSRTGFDGVSIEFSIDGSGSLFGSAYSIEFDNRYTHRCNRAGGGGNGDRSCWSGDNGGYKHTRIRIPAVDDSGSDLSTIQLRFTMASDSFVGDDGWLVDNVTIKPVDFN